MIVAVEVGGTSVPAWHATLIDALRAVPGVTVRVVKIEGGAWTPPRGVWRRVAGAMLRPVTVALDDGGTAAADVIVALAGGGGSDPRRWSFRLGSANDPDLPFSADIAGGALAFDVTLGRVQGAQREILRRGTFGATASYRATLRLALDEAARWPALLVRSLVSGAELRALGTEPLPVTSTASRATRTRLLLSLGTRVASMVGNQFFDVTEWNVGVVHGGPEKLLGDAPLAVRWLPRPAPMTFIADPFLCERDGRRVLFVEEYTYTRDRGILVAFDLDDDDRITSRSVVLDLPTHLSYPQPVEIDGELYLVPENCAAGEAAFYRCVRFPDRWERESVVFPFDAVDTSLFSYDGRWWAFCTRHRRGANLALNAYWAESPRGPWTGHALNPVIIDVGSARPAGKPFVHEGVLYRPGQDCIRSYGAGLVIARIDELTPQTYAETIVRRLDARSFGRWTDGIHTVNFGRDRFVIDAKRARWSPRKLSWSARKLRAKLLRRNRRPT